DLLLKSTPLRKLLVASALAAAVLTATHEKASANLIFTASGIDSSDQAPIAASVNFTFDAIGHILTMVITDLDPAVSRGSVLANVNVVTAPAPAISLPSSAGTIALTPGSSFVGAKPAFTLGQEWAYVAGSGGGAASSGFGVGGNVPGGSGNLCGST